jgi:hypothetical protein
VGLEGEGLNTISMIEDPKGCYLNEVCLTAFSTGQNWNEEACSPSFAAFDKAEGDHAKCQSKTIQLLHSVRCPRT